MGAGSITSNVKSDKKLVVVKSPEGQIETGIKNVTYIEVVSGLSEGEEVIIK